MTHNKYNMKLTENQFGYVYHLKKSVKFNRIHVFLKYIRKCSPALMFLWFIFMNYPIVISIICGVALFSWLGEVKTLSLRNINYYASQEFKKAYLEENFR